MLFKYLSLASLAALASAKECHNVTVPVSITSRNGVFNLAIPQTDNDVTTFALNQTRQGINFTQQVLTGYADVSGHYNLSAKYCVPGNGSEPKAVQVLTHGIGFDKTYWDLPYNGYNYSYINYALSKGYATVSYDRLGIGNSSHGEPLNEIQSFLEVEALNALSQQLRQGKFPGVNKTYSKLIHVGHSFGSAQTYSLANKYPDVTDGIVLTGFSANATFLPYFVAGGNFVLAKNNQPLRFGSLTAQQVIQGLEYIGLDTKVAPLNLDQATPSQNLPAGYLISSDAQANIYNFFYPGHFDPEFVKIAEMTKQPVTLGEILTLASVPMMNQFTKPVMVITGEFDVPFCGGDCLATGDPMKPSIPAGVQGAFAGVDKSKYRTVIQPQTGHGINTHYNSTGAYAAIHEFLSAQQL